MQSLRSLFASIRRTDLGSSLYTRSVNSLMSQMFLPAPEDIKTARWYELLRVAAAAYRSDYGRLTGLGTVLFKSSGKMTRGNAERRALGCLIVGIGLYRSGDIKSARSEFNAAARNRVVLGKMDSTAKLLMKHEPSLATLLTGSKHVRLGR